MLLACPECHSTFRMKPDTLGPGRTVRCSICRFEWFAEQRDLMPEPEQFQSFAALPPEQPVFDLTEQFNAESIPLGDEVFPSAEPVTVKPTDFSPPPPVLDLEDTEMQLPEEELLPEEEPVEEPPIDFESFNALLEKTERQQAAFFPTASRTGANWFAAILLVIAVIFTGTCWALVMRDSLAGTPVIGDALKSAGVKNTTNLAFADLTLVKTKLGAKKMRYAIKGSVINKGKEPREVPNVRIRLTDKQGNTLQQWDFAQAGFLKPGEEKKFNAMKLESTTVKDDYAFVLDLGSPFDLSLR